MNKSFQLKDRELRLLVLVLLIILEMRSSAALECAACVFFFFSENCEFGKKNHSKFVNPWEMKNLPWDRGKGSETMKVERSVHEHIGRVISTHFCQATLKHICHSKHEHLFKYLQSFIKNDVSNTITLKYLLNYSFSAVDVKVFLTYLARKCKSSSQVEDSIITY